MKSLPGRLLGSPYILYVEGESDERILRAWAEQCGALPVMDKICFKVMGGGNKQEMLRLANEHFDALKHVVLDVQRLMLFDYDDDKAFHPLADNPSLVEWRRKNVENYLLVPPAWRREALQVLHLSDDDLFAQPVLHVIDEFFADENLTLPAGKTWRNLAANIFSVVDGKRILFENSTSLFHALRKGDLPIDVLRERVAAVMTADEIHEDVHKFFGKLIAMVRPVS